MVAPVCYTSACGSPAAPAACSSDRIEALEKRSTAIALDGIEAVGTVCVDLWSGRRGDGSERVGMVCELIVGDGSERVGAP